MNSPPSPPPPPSYDFGYRRPPRSGNPINGLGERAPRRPEHVFHSSFGSPLEWAAMDHFFTLINAWGVVRHLIMIRWALRRAEGAPATVKDDLGGSVAAAQHIKARAEALGARKVGITPVTDAAAYAGREVPFPTAFVLGTPMRREAMAGVPDDRAAVEVMRAYREVCNTADLGGVRLESPARHGGLRPAARAGHARRSRGRRLLSPVSGLLDGLPSGGDRRPEADGARGRQVVRRLRPVHPLLHQDEGLRHLHRGVPLGGDRPRLHHLREDARAAPSHRHRAMSGGLRPPAAVPVGTGNAFVVVAPTHRIGGFSPLGSP